MTLQTARSLRKVLAGRPTVEGAGVNLSRVFGTREVPSFDPVLMLDDTFDGAKPRF